MKLLRHVYIFFAVLAGVAVASAQPIQPLVREGVTAKISAHVYVIPDESIPLVPNVGIVVGTRATLVIDTGLGRRNGEIVMKEMRKVSSREELYLATTHVHPEHDLGAAAFPATTKMLRSDDQQKDIAEFGLSLAKVFSERSPFIAELLKDAQFRRADLTFHQEYLLDLGGVRVRLVAMGANHTRGDTAFLVEPDGVLFTGDIAMKAQPAFASPYSNLAHWLSSLDVLEEMHASRLVPSHGPMGDGSMINGYRNYLTSIQTRAASLETEGKTAEQAVETITSELQGKYPDKGRLGGAIRAAYEEAN